MREGVSSSSYFVLFATRGVLTRSFCRLECLARTDPLTPVCLPGLPALGHSQPRPPPFRALSFAATCPSTAQEALEKRKRIILVLDPAAAAPGLDTTPLNDPEQFLRFLHKETLDAQAEERALGRKPDHELSASHLDRLLLNMKTRILYHRPADTFWAKTVPELAAALGWKATEEHVKHELSEFNVGPLGRAKNLLLVSRWSLRRGKLARGLRTHKVTPTAPLLTRRVCLLRRCTARQERSRPSSWRLGSRACALSG